RQLPRSIAGALSITTGIVRPVVHVRSIDQGNVNLGGAQKVARRAVVWTGEGVVLDFLACEAGRASARPLVTIAASPMVEGEHPSIRPSARVAAQKVARGVKLGKRWSAGTGSGASGRARSQAGASERSG